MKINIAVFLAAVTIGLSFTIEWVAQKYGPCVAARFLERGQYSENGLEDFIAKSPDNARGYAVPVLFPCDLLFMIALGGFLAFASVAAAEAIGPFKKVAWLFSIGPLLYVAADFFEDILLARMLWSPQAVTHGNVRLVQSMTAAKLITCSYGILQTIGLSGAVIL